MVVARAILPYHQPLGETLSGCCCTACGNCRNLPGILKCTKGRCVGFSQVVQTCLYCHLNPLACAPKGQSVPNSGVYASTGCMLRGQNLIAKHVLQSEQAKSNKSMLLTSTDAFTRNSAALVQNGRKGTQRKDT